MIPEGSLLGPVGNCGPNSPGKVCNLTLERKPISTKCGRNCGSGREVCAGLGLLGAVNWTCLEHLYMPQSFHPWVYMYVGEHARTHAHRQTVLHTKKGNKASSIVHGVVHLPNPFSSLCR